jgi:hypothetical protein
MHCFDRNNWHRLVSESRHVDSNIEISYKIDDGRFRFGEIILIRVYFKLQTMQNMAMNNKYR